MAVEVPMPRLSDTMEQGTIARWVKMKAIPSPRVT